MSNTATVLAFDFGASSGRAIRAVYDGQNLTYEEIHRFENIPIEKDGHLCWNVETLLKEIHTAIQKAGTFDSLGFDTNRIDKVDTAVDDSDLIAGCNIQSTHLLYNSVAL